VPFLPSSVYEIGLRLPGGGLLDSVAVTWMLLLRHAESEWNASGRWQGWADPPLSPEGERQAIEAGRRLRPIGFTAAVASDLRRARRTAELAFGGPVQIDAGLREYDVGEWSGLSRAEIETRWPGALEDWHQGRLVATPGGEIRDTFVARIAAAVTRVGAAHPGGIVLVITHGGVISALERSLGESVESAVFDGQRRSPKTPSSRMAQEALESVGGRQTAGLSACLWGLHDPVDFMPAHLGPARSPGARVHGEGECDGHRDHEALLSRGRHGCA
jgi:broad specificity phosphatase PhoE